jgi:hypothetical protein
MLFIALQSRTKTYRTSKIYLCFLTSRRGSFEDELSYSKNSKRFSSPLFKPYAQLVSKHQVRDHQENFKQRRVHHFACSSQPGINKEVKCINTIRGVPAQQLQCKEYNFERSAIE